MRRSSGVLAWRQRTASFAVIASHQPLPRFFVSHTNCSVYGARRQLHASSLLLKERPHLAINPAAGGEANSLSEATGARTRHPSPEEALSRHVNTLVGQRNATEAVRVVLSGLRGEWPVCRGGEAIPVPATAANTADNVAASSSSVVFSAKAFAAALHACEATGNAQEGLALVAEVRRHPRSGGTTNWLQSEHVLSVILRLQCAAGDRDGAVHMVAYLAQHDLLRLRSASVFLRFCCASLHDRPLAFAAYEQVLKRKLELAEPDYLSLGRLCVEVREPIETLFFMLDEMREHVPEVSQQFVRDVLQAWVAMANESQLDKSGCENAAPHYGLSIVQQIRLQEVAACSASTALASNAAPAAETLRRNAGGPESSSARRCGVCPSCNTELSGYPFTAACRAHLLRELKDIVIPQACRTPRAVQGFAHWQRYIHARLDSSDRVDVFVDGANLGYYGLSSWYDVAKKKLMIDRGVPESRITAADLHFNLQCKAPGKSVDVGVNFELIDSAVRLAVETHGLRRPLVMLHERHVEPRFMTADDAHIVQRWRNQGWLYCSPSGLNDDLCWLYGALLMTDATDAAPTLTASQHRALVCTNDMMRDHHFRLLSPRTFTRWRDRHRIGFRCARVENRTELYWDLPAPFERCIQRHSSSSTALHANAGSGGRGDAGSGTAQTVTWHIPFYERCETPAASREAPPVSKACDSVSDVAAEDSENAVADGSTEVPPSAADTPKPAPWVCLTMTL